MKTKEFISKATDGLIGSAVNGVLWYLFLVGASFGKSKTSYGMHKAFREADEALNEFNYDTFKHVLSYLRRLKLIEKKKTYTGFEIEVTKLGKERLAQTIPKYMEQRPWDGHLYVISYAIPESRHPSRNTLRDYLKRIGCARLQESLWMTPYNPRVILDEFMEEHGIAGTMLISKLGKDGAIGEEDLPSLLERVYQLKKLNERYKDFLSNLRNRRMNVFQVAVKYQSILKDDSQLPFALLPKDWLGDRAYTEFRNYVKLYNRPVV